MGAIQAHNQKQWRYSTAQRYAIYSQKPVKLEEWLIKTYTNPGETVLDNCMGSGTTGVACINTNRDFIGIEKNPDYYKTATSRIKEAQDNGKHGDQKKQPDHD